MVLTTEQLLSQKLETVVERYEQIGRLLSDPKIMDNHQEFQRLGKERAELAPLIEAYEEYQKLLKATEETQGILEASKSEPGLRELAEPELKELSHQQAALE